VSANILGLDFHVCPVFLGWSLDLPYITKAFETARLVMGRRNVDFDEKEAAILEHVLPKVKKWRKE
jgi:hypothetical protein